MSTSESKLSRHRIAAFLQAERRSTHCLQRHVVLLRMLEVSGLNRSPRAIILAKSGARWFSQSLQKISDRPYVRCHQLVMDAFPRRDAYNSGGS
jgi:hypothetical protein